MSRYHTAEGTRTMRRNWVHLDKRGTSCVVIGTDGHPLRRLPAYELTLLRAKPRRLAGRTAQRAAATRELLSGECCYAFHCKTTGLIKLGRTTDVIKRWMNLETGGGRPLQLLTVWKTRDSAALERGLHDAHAAHRTLGEWFHADPVLAALRVIASKPTREEVDEEAIRRAASRAFIRP